MVIQMKLWVGDGFFPHAAEEEELKGVKQARWRREEENGREREQQQLGFNKSMQSSLCKKERKKEGDLTKIKRNHGSIVIDHVKCVVELRPCEMSDALKTGGGISKFISA